MRVSARAACAALLAVSLAAAPSRARESNAVHPDDETEVFTGGEDTESAHPVAGTVKMIAPPVRMSETPGSVRMPAPLLGQHTEQVLRERLALDDAEIARLRATGVIN